MSDIEEAHFLLQLAVHLSTKVNKEQHCYKNLQLKLAIMRNGRNSYTPLLQLATLYLYPEFKKKPNLSMIYLNQNLI